MNQQLQTGDRAEGRHRVIGRRRAGIADVPDHDLELLAAGLRKSLELGPESPVPMLQAAVHHEAAKRKRARRPEGTEESE